MKGKLGDVREEKRGEIRKNRESRRGGGISEGCGRRCEGGSERKEIKK